MATKVQDFLKANPYYIGRANTANRTRPEEKKGKKGSGNQSWLSSIISELSGAGGAVGGAATGAALGSVVPGIGNIIGGIGGGIVGGFLGGTGGRLVENQVRDNEMRLGDALKEGAVSGAFGAIGPAWQGARGLGVIGKAGGGGIRAGAKGLAGISDDAARAAAGKAISRGGKKAAQGIVTGAGKAPNTLQVAGRGFAGNAQGVGIGAKAPGLQNLGAQESDDILAALTEVGIKRSNPEKAVRSLEPIIKKRGADIASKYAKSGVKYSTKQIDDVSSRVLQQIADDPTISLTKSQSDDVFRQLGLLGKAKTPEQAWKFQKALGNAINFGKNADSKLVQKEAIARIMRREIGGLLDDTVKSVRVDRTLYGRLKDADTLMKVASKQADKSGLFARATTSAPVRAAESKFGGALEATGNLVARPTVANSGRITGGALARGFVNGGQPVAQDPTQEDEDEQGNYIGPDTTLYGELAAQGQQDPTQVPQGLPQFDGQQPQAYGLEQGLQDAYRVLGEGATSSQYLQYAKAFMAQNEDQGGGGPDITKITGQQYQLATRGANGVAELEALLQNDPGVLDRSATPGRKLPIVGGFISDAADTGDFDAIGYNVASALLRIETGAQANPAEIKNLQTQMMPRAGDSPQTVETKLAQLRQAFGGILNTANNGSPGSASTLQDLIQQGAY